MWLVRRMDGLEGEYDGYAKTLKRDVRPGTGCLITVKWWASRNDVRKSPTADSFPEMDGIETRSRWRERKGDESMRDSEVRAGGAESGDCWSGVAAVRLARANTVRDGSFIPGIVYLSQSQLEVKSVTRG